MIKECIKKLIKKNDLTPKEMGSAFNEIMSGVATVSQISAFLTGLRIKGETVEEITAAARVMRSKALNIKNGKQVIDLEIEPLVDTCGTGGTNINTFNISTASAFVIAGAGIKVAKHGNRSASGHCGSADVLEELGVNINISPEKLLDCINKVGIGFMFAPIYHGAMKYAAPVRKDLGIRTIFNILGPLANPLNTNVQILGVYDGKLVDIVIKVLKNLGTKRAMVVYGYDGLDEISITGPTKVAQLLNNKISRYTINPKDFGFKKSTLKSIQGKDARFNANVIRNVLSGEKSARRNIVIMNSASAIYISGMAKNIKEGTLIAAHSIDSYAAISKLEQLTEITNRG